MPQTLYSESVLLILNGTALKVLMPFWLSTEDTKILIH